MSPNSPLSLKGFSSGQRRDATAPVPVVENAPPPVVEPDSQSLSAPPAADSASPAPVANAPDAAIPTPAAREPELAAPAFRRAYSVEPALLVPEPVSIDPPPESPVALVHDAPSPAAPFSETPAALVPEALAPVETSDAPVESPPIEASQLEEALSACATAFSAGFPNSPARTARRQRACRRRRASERRIIPHSHTAV